MCTKSKETTCCQNPKELKKDIKNCSKAQIQKCHGNQEGHHCRKNKEEDHK